MKEQYRGLNKKESDWSWVQFFEPIFAVFVTCLMLLGACFVGVFVAGGMKKPRLPKL